MSRDVSTDPVDLAAWDSRDVPTHGRGYSYLAPWHGCLAHNHDHCPDCRTCDCYDDGCV